MDQFLRVEWTAAFPLWTLNLAQRDTVDGARCALPPTSSCLYQLACTGTVPEVLDARIMQVSKCAHHAGKVQLGMGVPVPPYEYDRILPVELYQYLLAYSSRCR